MADHKYRTENEYTSLLFSIDFGYTIFQSKIYSWGKIFTRCLEFPKMQLKIRSKKLTNSLQSSIILYIIYYFRIKIFKMQKERRKSLPKYLRLMLCSQMIRRGLSMIIPLLAHLLTPPIGISQNTTNGKIQNSILALITSKI